MVCLTVDRVPMVKTKLCQDLPVAPLPFVKWQCSHDGFKI